MQELQTMAMDSSVPIQQGFSGASKAPERGAGCPRLISSPTAEGGTKERRI
jgi:hypothetical protein